MPDDGDCGCHDGQPADHAAPPAGTTIPGKTAPIRRIAHHYGLPTGRSEKPELAPLAAAEKPRRRLDLVRTELPLVERAPITVSAAGGNLLVSEIGLASFSGRFRGGVVPPPDEDGRIRGADLPDAPDEGEVYLRRVPGEPAVSGCTPVGTVTCRRRGLVAMPVVDEQSMTMHLEFGEPQYKLEGTHTVCVSIAVFQIWKGKAYEKYYRRFDCCCEFLGASFDCWTELEYSHDGPGRAVEYRDTLKTITRCDTDWGRWTLEQFQDLLGKAVEGLGGAIGGGVGKAAGDALGEIAKDILDKVKAQAQRVLGTGGGGTSGGGGGTP